MRIINFVLILLFTASSFCSKVHAQEEADDIIIISQKVGDEIDKTERKIFRLFPAVKNFQSAVFVKKADGRYFSKISYFDDESKELKIKYEEKSEESINNLTYYIDNFAEIFLERRNTAYQPAEPEAPDSTVPKKIDVVFRYGQGGFSDSRSELGKLGGGQLVLDVKPADFPLGLSLLTEYYTNSAEPSHSYEIAALLALNIIYMDNLLKLKKTNFFLSAGLGQAVVPREGSGSKMVRSIVYNVEAGINSRLLWGIGFYGAGKYLYANKRENGAQLINFSEYILMLGITFNFSFKVPFL